MSSPVPKKWSSCSSPLFQGMPLGDILHGEAPQKKLLQYPIKKLSGNQTAKSTFEMGKINRKITYYKWCIFQHAMCDYRRVYSYIPLINHRIGDFCPSTSTVNWGRSMNFDQESQRGWGRSPEGCCDVVLLLNFL